MKARAADLRTVPLISNRDACEVFAAWAIEHEIRRGTVHARLLNRNSGREKVYFASPEADGPIKIGSSRDPIRRVTALRTPAGDPMVPRVVIADFNFIDELMLHSFLRKFSITSDPHACNHEFYRRGTPVELLMNRLVAAAIGRLPTLFRVPSVRRAPRPESSSAA